jgi:signal transduction histidine kinase
MALSLRYRIVLTLAPLLALLAALGAGGVVLLYRLGGSIDLILRENYESVIAMERLNEALERIDSSYQFALAGREKEARHQYRENWKRYDESLRKEEDNVTIHPREDELVARLDELTRRYRRQGDAFYARPPGRAQRQQDYFGPAGLLNTFKEIKQVSGDILRLNEENMVEASRESRALADRSLLWFGAGLAGVVVLAGLFAAHTIRSVLHPIRAVTQSALAIGLGNLDQVVPVTSRDELGELAEAFNTMGRQLRQYRQTGYARLLRAQRTSQATIDSFPDPVLVVDADGHVEMANPAAQRLFGVTGRQEGAPPVLTWEPPEPLRRPLQEAVRDQRPYLPEGFDRAVLLPVNGQDHSFLPRLLPIRDPYGHSLGAAVLLEDVTRFRLLDQVKSDLAATVSHELKTPLTSIRLALHLLLEEAAGPLTPKQTELLLDARDNAERLLDRIDRLLDLARLEQKREPLDLAPEAPAALLRAAAEAIRPRAEDKGVEVAVEVSGEEADLPPVAADAGRLGHALGNLLDNALAYTDRGGRITLSAAAEGDRVVLAVADTGQGIPPEHLGHVFEKFFRVPGQSRHGGTGLGLAIVREIAQAHGGTVTCDSQPGRGTVFRLTLPAWTGRPASALGEGPVVSGLAASQGP